MCLSSCSYSVSLSVHWPSFKWIELYSVVLTMMFNVLIVLFVTINLTVAQVTYNQDWRPGKRSLGLLPFRSDPMPMIMDKDDHEPSSHVDQEARTRVWLYLNYFLIICPNCVINHFLQDGDFLRTLSSCVHKAIDQSRHRYDELSVAKKHHDDYFNWFNYIALSWCISRLSYNFSCTSQWVTIKYIV